MLLNYLKNNIATNKEIQKYCNLTARQVLLQIKKLGNKIIKIPNGKSPKYALTTNAFGVGDTIHIWEVDNFRKHSAIATLRPLAIGGFFVEKDIQMPKVFLGEYDNGLYADLPYFLRDMAPKGFLGKKIAENLLKIDNSFPIHLSAWNNEHIGRYLLANTDNSIGNLKFGNNTNLNLRTNLTKHNRDDYLDIADNIINNDTILSSAGGEQQKFTTFCTNLNSHVIVKFSSKGNNTNAKRWKDILITEHYANKVINNHSLIAAANTKIIEDGDRLFLEAERFDRIKEYGRRSMISLTMIDAEFVGTGDNWLNSATSLYGQKLLTNQDLINVEILAIFAKLINNTDTHLGNISLKIHGDGFGLLPIYDMCSMGFAPKSNGEIVPFKFNQPEIETKNDVKLKFIKKMAFNFWCLLRNDSIISNEFKNFIVSDILPNYDDIEYQHTIF